MNLKRRLLITCVLMGLLILVLSSVSFAMKLTVWNWHEPNMKLLEEKAEQYEKENPDIEIETSILPFDDYWKKVMTGLASGQMPDIIQFHNSKTGVFLDYLEPYPEEMFPLAEMQQKHMSFDQAFNFEGEFYFYPVGAMSSLVYYNKDLWKEAGLTEKDYPETWEELRHIAKKLTKYDEDGNVEIAGFGLNGYASLYWNDLHYQLGGYLYNEEGTEVTWNNEKGLKAAKFIHQLIYEDKVTEPGFLEFTEAMGTGNAAMVYSWTWLTGSLDHNYPDLNYGVFPLPTPDGDYYPAVARNNFSVGNAVLNLLPENRKKEAFKFLEYLYSDEDYMAKLCKGLSVVPANKELWNHPKIKNDPVINTAKKSIEYTIFPGELPDPIHKVALNTIEDSIMNGVSPAEAVEKAEAEGNRILNERPLKWVIERDYSPPTE